MRIHRIIGTVLVLVMALAALGPGTAVSAPPPPAQGCGPNFWAKSANLDQWTKFKPTDKFKAVFKRSDFGRKSLLKVVRQGGTKKKKAGRHAVAALLNATYSVRNSDEFWYRMARAGEYRTVPFEVIRFWRQWNYSQFLSNAKPANFAGCPLN